MSSSIRWIAVVSAVLLVISSRPPERAVAGDEIAQQAAISTARKFVSDLGLRPDGSVPRALRRPGPYESEGLSRLPPRWEVALGEYSMVLDAVTGKPMTFYNGHRVWEIIHRIGRTGKKRFASQAEAMAYIRQLSKKLGMPQTWALKNPAKAGKTDARGDVRAEFRERPHGYAFLEPGGGNGAYFALDAQDGTLKSWGQQTTVITDPPKRKVTRQQAIVAAAAAYTKYYGGRRPSPHGGPPNPAGIQLGYARPFLNSTPATHARLMWQVPFGIEPVRVDAETGAVVEVLAMH